MFTAQNISPELTVEESSSDIWIPSPYVVADKHVENDDLVTFVYEPASEDILDPMQPGQFNMLYAFGIGEIPISVSSLISDHPRITHTIQNVGAVSKACCNMRVGDQIGLRGPFGTPWPVEDAKFKDVIIMAGGVGFAPLRPVVEFIEEYRDDYGEVNFLFGTRDPHSILFHQDVISLQSDPSVNFQITVDHSFSNWRGNVGVVTTLVEKAEFDPENTVAFVCGPEIMMRYGAYSLIDAGVDEENIFISMERNMKCAIGHCGHCQYGPLFVCKDGPVFLYPAIKNYLNIREL